MVELLQTYLQRNGFDAKAFSQELGKFQESLITLDYSSPKLVDEFFHTVDLEILAKNLKYELMEIGLRHSTKNIFISIISQEMSENICPHNVSNSLECEKVCRAKQHLLNSPYKNGCPMGCIPDNYILYYTLAGKYSVEHTIYITWNLSLKTKYRTDVSKYLQMYIYQNIFPYYETFDKGHDLHHIQDVIRRSFQISSYLDDQLNMDIIFAVAAYHDLGIKIARKNHATHSATLVREDNILKHFFSKDEIETIASAVEDHSTSLNREPRNIYGKIVCDADKDDDYLKGLKRAWEYTKVYYPDYSFEQMMDNCYEQLNKKFGPNGLVHFWILNDENSEFVNMMKKMALDRYLFEEVLKKAISQ
ncbi:MAG: HD domain-containing protein [Clostridia bacterium]|nr:HD domain-containing protein [Clostridia bacterium]